MQERQNVVVVGYPRSGNTWLARLLGNALNSPVTGLKKAMPLANEGKDRPGPYWVRQLHLHPHAGPCEHKVALVNAGTFCLDNWRDERIAFIVRDPRDVAVSAASYWHMPLAKTVRRMKDAKFPMGFGPWSKFVRDWLHVYKNNVDHRMIVVKYEALNEDTVAILGAALAMLDLEPVKPLEQVAAEESIEAKRKQVMKDGDQRPYGKDIQLHHLRKGIVGDWKNWDWSSIGPFADETFGPTMDLLGYEREENWWSSR